MRIKKHECKVCGETNIEAFHSNNKSKCKTCVSEHNKIVYRAMPIELKKAKIELSKSYQKENIYKTRCGSIRDRCKKKNLENEITEEFLEELDKKQGYKCAYTGILFDNNNPIYSMSVDRIDSTKGYLKDNIQLVLSYVNKMKGEYGEPIMINIMRKVVSNYDNRIY